MRENNNSGSGMTLDSIMDWFETYQSNGVRTLTDAEKQFLADNNIAVEMIQETDSELYLVIPSSQSVLLNDEALSAIHAAKDAPDAAASAATAGSGGTVGTIFTFIANAISTVGSAGTAGTSGTLNLVFGEEHTVSQEQKDKSKLALSVELAAFNNSHK